MRTEGKWVRQSDHDGGILAVDLEPEPDHVLLYSGSYLQKDDASFIASCAGPAEAGWRATIAAIAGLRRLALPPQVEAPDEIHQAWQQDADEANEHLQAIIAAWPEELL